jgi:hypothetical protein
VRSNLLNICTQSDIPNNVTPKQSTALDILLRNDSEENIDEVTRYLLEPQINHNLDPNNWWLENEKQYPRVSLLAKQILSVPASSASSE